MSINVHFTEQDWERIARDWTAWWASELERPMVIIVSLDPSPGVELPDAHHFASNFSLILPADEVLAHLQRRIEAQRFYGDAFPKWFPNFGPGIAAGFLSSKVMCAKLADAVSCFTSRNAAPKCTSRNTLRRTKRARFINRSPAKDNLSANNANEKKNQQRFARFADKKSSEGNIPTAPHRRRTEDTADLSRRQREWTENEGVIGSRAESEQFPWDQIHFNRAAVELAARHLPAGMKLMAGGSLFEHVMKIWSGANVSSISS